MDKVITGISYNTDLDTAHNPFGIPESVLGVVTYSDGTSKHISSVEEVSGALKAFEAQMIEASQPKTLTTDVYLHSDKETNYEAGRELGLKDEALSEFAYTCSEVCVTVEIDRKTGRAMVTHFNGAKLVTPVEV